MARACGLEVELEKVLTSLSYPTLTPTLAGEGANLSEGATSTLAPTL